VSTHSLPIYFPFFEQCGTCYVTIYFLLFFMCVAPKS
jgi:hypothetical protein